MLSLDNILVLKGGVKVLNIKNSSFDFSKRYLIHGKTGSGKTTLFDLMSGVEKPVQGDVIVDDLSLYNSGFIELSLLRKKMGVMYDVPGLISNQNIYENIRLAVNSKKIQFDQSLKDVLFSKYLRRFDLCDHLNSRPGVLSLDQKRIVSFIRAVISQPEFLIFDGFSEFVLGPYKSIILNILDELKEKSVGGVFICRENFNIGMKFDSVLELKDGDLYEQ